MTKKSRDNEPTFDKQIGDYAMKENNPDDPVFSGAYHKFMVNLLKTRDVAVKNELAKTVAEMLIENNATITATIQEMLSKQTATVGSAVGEVMVAIEGMAKDIKEIKQTVKIHDEKINQEFIEIAKHELRLNQKKKDIAELKAKVELFNPGMIKQLLDDIEEIKPAIKKFNIYSSKGNTFIRVALSMIVGWAITWSVFIFLLRNVWHLIK